MTGVRRHSKVSPPLGELAREHDVHQLGVVVGSCQFLRLMISFIVDIVKVYVAANVGMGIHVDHPGLAGSDEEVLQKVGQEKVTQVVGLGNNFQTIFAQVTPSIRPATSTSII